ncbi:MAG: hypothetical protein H0W64_11365 [Gammaproteobacteria bacterium]|nr:hypothetical protein [Gammaproteobacteria bacterium]
MINDIEVKAYSDGVALRITFSDPNLYKTIKEKYKLNSFMCEDEKLFLHYQKSYASLDKLHNLLDEIDKAAHDKSNRDCLALILQAKTNLEKNKYKKLNDAPLTNYMNRNALYKTIPLESHHTLSPKSVKKRPEITGEIDVQIQKVNNLYTKFETFYNLKIFLNTSKAILDEIVERYDIPIKSNILRIQQNEWMYELSQTYKFAHRGQLANLIAFLLEKKFISGERGKELTENLMNTPPCKDSDLTPLFNGEPLTKDYIYEKLTVAWDPYYDSAELHRTEEAKQSDLTFLNQNLFEEIEKKFSTLFSNQSYGLIQKLILVCKDNTHWFENKYQEKLAILIDKYQSIADSHHETVPTKSFNP